MFEDVRCSTCTDFLKDARGCYGFAKPQEIEGVEIKKCPVKELTGQTVMYLEIAKHYRNGYLYTGNCIANEPAKLIEAINTVNNMIAEKESKLDG
jgi:hypothetical protein